MSLQRGDYVWIERDDKRMQAMVTLASPNGKSLIVMFDGMFGGYLGMMPLSFEDGEYVDLIERKPVKLERLESEAN